MRTPTSPKPPVPKPADEKITINVGCLDLGQIELLVQEAGQTLQIRVLGLATIAADVTPELALATIESLTVLGALHASPAVKAALAGRIY